MLQLLITLKLQKQMENFYNFCCCCSFVMLWSHFLPNHSSEGCRNTIYYKTRVHILTSVYVLKICKLQCDPTTRV